MDPVKLKNPMLTHYELLDRLALTVTPHQVLRHHQMVQAPHMREGQRFYDLPYFRSLELYNFGFLGMAPTKECPWHRGTSIDLAAAIYAIGGAPTMANYKAAMAEMIDKMIPEYHWMREVWRKALIPMSRWAWVRSRLVFELEYNMDDQHVFQRVRRLLRTFMNIRLPARAYKSMSLAYSMWGCPVGLQALYIKNKKARHECIPLNPHARYALGGDYHRFNVKQESVVMLFDDYLHALPVFQGRNNVLWLYENFQTPQETAIWTPPRATYVLRHGASIPEALGYLQEQGCIMSITKLERSGFVRRPVSYRESLRRIYPLLRKNDNLFSSVIDRENLYDVYIQEYAQDPLNTYELILRARHVLLDVPDCLPVSG